MHMDCNADTNGNTWTSTLNSQAQPDQPNRSVGRAATADAPPSEHLSTAHGAGVGDLVWLPSPTTHLPPQPHHVQLSPKLTQAMKYPVLRPLAHYIEPILQLSAACDLPDLYFTSSFSAYMHPLSPYIHAYIFRKRSFLHPTKPPSSSPALLASMLWVAAQTNDTVFLTSTPSTRRSVRQKLLELTIRLLRPLIHGSFTGGGMTLDRWSDNILDQVALGAPGGLHSGRAHLEGLGSNQWHLVSATALDDVVTYMHVASIVSPSEAKAASMRWWHAAFSQARELKLNREMDQPSWTNVKISESTFADATDPRAPGSYGSTNNGNFWEQSGERTAGVWSSA